MVIVELTFWISLSLITYPYFIYPICLTCLAVVVPPDVNAFEIEFCPFITIVLAAYNEANCIRDKIENCLGLDYPQERLKILVGSDGSDDGTNHIAREFDGRGVQLLEFSPRRGKMSTVNRVVQEATGEICVFSDISEMFERDALRKLVRHFSDQSIGAVTGNHIFHEKDSGIGKGTSFYWKFQRFLQSIESRLHTVCQCDGTIYACRRELFPFPPDETINDDIAVPLGILSQGKRVIFEPEAIARGNVLPASSNFFRQKIRGQAGRYQNFAQFPRMFLPWPFRQWWIFASHMVMPVLVPWFLVICLIANTVLAFSGNPVYQFFLTTQIAFYLTATIGWFGEKVQFYVPFTTLPFYFVIANVGSLFGFFAYVNGLQRATWRKVE